MYFDLSVGSKKSYLQWFPFSRITEDEAQYISSEEFFEKYIKSCICVVSASNASIRKFSSKGRRKL